MLRRRRRLLNHVVLGLNLRKNVSQPTTILANNDRDSVANDFLLTVQKTKEGISLATPPLPPSINVASFHRVR